MRTLPLHELKAGTLYRCALSGQLVLVESISKHNGFTRADARYFNHSTGQYQNLVVHDFQLGPAPEGWYDGVIWGPTPTHKLGTVELFEQ